VTDEERVAGFRERNGLPAFTPFADGPGDGCRFPAAELPRLAAPGDRVLLGTGFPNIPHSCAAALEGLERAGPGPSQPTIPLRSVIEIRRPSGPVPVTFPTSGGMIVSRAFTQSRSREHA
jgi:hypothetical protein